MARKKIREYDSKRLLKTHISRLKGLNLPLNVAQVMSVPHVKDLRVQEARSCKDRFLKMMMR